MKSCLMTCSLLFTLQAAAEDLSRAIIEGNNKAAAAIEQQEYARAHDVILHTIGKTKNVPELQYNLGLAFAGLGQAEQAQKSYTQAAQNPSSSVARFSAQFNLAEMAQKEQKIPEALTHYQAALLENPDSIEVKTNIELMIRDQQQQQQQKQQQGDQGNKQDQQKKQDQKDQKQDKKDSKSDPQKEQKPEQGDKDQKEDQKKDQQKDQQPQGHQKNKPQPQPFKSEQLSAGDVKKILEELDRQEKRVRAEFNNKQVKEKPRDKDW